MTATPTHLRLDTDHSWAVVDVETSGFQPDSGRVLSVAALALDAAGRPQQRFSSLIDAGCDPGPVHIHGLTRERLAGAPRFEQIAPELLGMLDGRILVAHNAAFDHRFLAAEVVRAGMAMPVQRRLCTLALSRRLGLAVPDHKLATLAAYWGVPQLRAHDALDDVEVLARILTHSLLLAARLELPLPLVGGDGKDEVDVGPVRPTTPRCPWRNPGRLDPGRPLVQGMRVAVTGAVSEPREDVVERLVAAGLDVTRSVSRLTSVLVTNHPVIATRMSAAIAHLRGYDVNTEEVHSAVLISLLGSAGAGTLKKAGVEIGKKTTMAAVQKLPGRVLIELNKKIGFRLVTKAGEKGVVNLTKLVPLVGGPVGAAIDGVSCRSIATYALVTFEQQ